MLSAAGKLRVSLLQVNALVHALHSFPEGMAKMWTLMSQLVRLAKEGEGTAAETAYIDFTQHPLAKGITANYSLVL